MNKLISMNSLNLINVIYFFSSMAVVVVQRMHVDSSCPYNCPDTIIFCDLIMMTSLIKKNQR